VIRPRKGVAQRGKVDCRQDRKRILGGSDFDGSFRHHHRGGGDQPDPPTNTGPARIRVTPIPDVDIGRIAGVSGRSLLKPR